MNKSPAVLPVCEIEWCNIIEMLAVLVILIKSTVSCDACCYRLLYILGRHLFLNANLFTYLRQEAEREGQRIQSRFCADSSEPDTGLELMTHEIMTWREVRHLTHWATQAPLSRRLTENWKKKKFWATFYTILKCKKHLHWWMKKEIYSSICLKKCIQSSLDFFGFLGSYSITTINYLRKELRESLPSPHITIVEFESRGWLLNQQQRWVSDIAHYITQSPV